MHVTVFEQPQAKLTYDPSGPRRYGNVSNRLEIVDSLRSWHVPIAIPTFLFFWMYQTEIPREHDVTLSLDRIDLPRGKAGYVFSALVDFPIPQLYDLWTIPESSFPLWMRDRNCHV